MKKHFPLFAYLNWLKAGLLSLCLTGTGLAWGQTLTPVADRDDYGANSGSAPVLNASQWQTAYVKFDLTSVGATVSAAKLRLYRSDAQQGALNVTLYQTGDGWSEITTAGFPAKGSLIQSVSSAAVGYVEFDVKAYVQAQKSGDGTVSFAFNTDKGGWTGFASRESSTNQPQLVVTAGSASGTAPLANAAFVGKRIALRGVNGKFLQAANGAGQLVANADVVYNGAGSWEQFDVLDNGDGWVSFRAVANNLIVQARDGYNACSGTLIPNTTNQSDWEKYQLLDKGNSTICLKLKANGKIVQLQNGGVNPSTDGLAACTDNQQSWETFTVSVYSTGGNSGGNGGGGNSSTYNRVRQFGTNVNVMYSDEGCDNVWAKGHYLRAKNLNFATETNPWNAAFLDEAKMYQVIRFMNWTGGNGDATTNWTDRTLKSDPYQFGGWMGPNGTDIQARQQTSGRSTRGVAYEWLMDLCNRVGSDMWLNIPYRTIDPADFPNGDDFNNEYVHKLAILLKHGVDMQRVSLKNLPGIGNKTNLSLLSGKDKSFFLANGGVDVGVALNSAAKIYVEYSNELWCCSRPQVLYAMDKAKQIGYPNDQYSYHKFGAYAEVRVWKAFRDVFGSDARIKYVAGPCENWDVKINEAFAIYNSTDANRNPWAIKPSYWKWATYVGTDGKSTDSGFPTAWDNAVVQTAEADVSGRRSWKSLRDQLKNSYNLDLISYEGGQALADDDGAHDARSFSAGAGGTYDRYKQWLQYADKYFVLTCHYTDYGNGADCNDIERTTWGAKSYPGQTINKFKFDAIKAWIDGSIPAITNQPSAANAARQLAAPGTEAALSVYPNPNYGDATVEFSTRQDQRITLQVQGKTGLVGLFTLPIKAGRATYKLPFHLPPGLYSVRTTLNGQKQSFMLQVE